MRRHNKGHRKTRRTLSLLALTILLLLILSFVYIGLIRKIDTGEIISVVTEDIRNTKDIFEMPPREAHLDVRTLCQHPELPTGCEATAAVMVLDYLGETVYLEDFARLLPCSRLSETDEGRCGEDPEKYFIGSPFEQASSFGCFENVIVETVNQNYPDCRAEREEGTLDTLCRFLNEGQPVLIWATMGMQEINYQTAWRLPDGSMFQWPGREHCLVLVGYDSESYYFNDPQEGECIPYEKELAQQRYEEMGSRAVVIVKRQAVTDQK